MLYTTNWKPCLISSLSPSNSQWRFVLLLSSLVVSISLSTSVSHINTIQQNLTRELSSRTQSYLSSQIMDSIMRNIYISKEQAPCDTEKEEYSIVRVFECFNGRKLSWICFPWFLAARMRNTTLWGSLSKQAWSSFRNSKASCRKWTSRPFQWEIRMLPQPSLCSNPSVFVCSGGGVLFVVTSLDENITNGTIQTSVNQPTEKRLFHSSSEIFDDYRKRRRQQ